MRDRHHAAAAQSLENPEQQQHLEIAGEAAEHRAQREQREADDEERLAAERLGEEAAGGQSDGVGDEIGRHDPGRLVVADP